MAPTRGQRELRLELGQELRLELGRELRLELRLELGRELRLELRPRRSKVNCHFQSEFERYFVI